MFTVPAYSLDITHATAFVFKLFIPIGTLLAVWSPLCPLLSLSSRPFTSKKFSRFFPMKKSIHCSYFSSRCLQFCRGLYHSRCLIGNAYLFYFLWIPKRQKPYRSTSIIPTQGLIPKWSLWNACESLNKEINEWRFFNFSIIFIMTLIPFSGMRGKYFAYVSGFEIVYTKPFFSELRALCCSC